jgi:hypothetical protein|tara:strand:+ start:98 stop:265 length:168 start_codon:yes stop_codon:yes gene_type:complete
MIIIGVNERGRKLFLAIKDGIRGIHPELERSPVQTSSCAAKVGELTTDECQGAPS